MSQQVKVSTSALGMTYIIQNIIITVKYIKECTYVVSRSPYKNTLTVTAVPCGHIIG